MTELELHKIILSRAQANILNLDLGSSETWAVYFLDDQDQTAEYWCWLGSLWVIAIIAVIVLYLLLVIVYGPLCFDVLVILIDAFQLLFIETKISVWIDFFCFSWREWLRQAGPQKKICWFWTWLCYSIPPSGIYNIAIFRLNMKMRKGKGIWFELKEWKE